MAASDDVYDVILDVLTSHALSIGYFEFVNTHESKVSPGYGLTADIWADRFDPIRQSGLAATSIRIIYMIRIRASLSQEPADKIDSSMSRAAFTLIRTFMANFELDGNARMVDVRGANNVPLSAQAGYIPTGDTKERIYDVTVPVLVNDMWDEAP